MSGAADDLQRRITGLLLDALDGTGFVLAGAGAIRAHGLTDRPTEDDAHLVISAHPVGGS